MNSAAYTEISVWAVSFCAIIIYIGIIKEITQKLTIFMRKFLRKICNSLIFSVVCGDSRSRTDDPLLAKQVL